MTLTRREFLAGTGALAGLGFLAPIVGRTNPVFGLHSGAPVDPSSALRNRLVVIFQQGGNDGLNTVIPTGGSRYDVYRQVRPTISYLNTGATAPLPLDRTTGDIDWNLGVNHKLKTLHQLYSQDRVAIVQGVDYTSHNYSHFESTDIWESGLPEFSNDSGWLGRHLDRAGIAEGELRGVGIGSELPFILRGRNYQGVGIASLPLQFSDGTAAIGDARHAALQAYGAAMWAEPERQFMADQGEVTVKTVQALEGAPVPPRTANGLANSLLAARTLLTQNLGVECVFVTQPGYDTHTGQVAAQESLLTNLDQGIEAFFYGTLAGADLGVGALAPGVADRTLVITMSEFGRRIGENGGSLGVLAGTDHGAAAPLFVIGPPGGAPGATGHGLVPGLHGDHPDMGTTLVPADNLFKTTELRQVYEAVLQNWLQDTDPAYETPYPPLPGLFTSAP